MLGPPRFVFEHGARTTRRRALAERAGACKPTGRVLPGYPDGTPYGRVLPPVPLGSLDCTAAAASPRAARAVPSCAGAYLSGAAGGNQCPAGSERIVTEAACRTAAAAAGKTPYSSFVRTSPDVPRGCYYESTNIAAFNTHAVGAGYSTQPLCAALDTTGAPPPMMFAAALRVCAAGVRQRRCGGAVWARAVCVYVPSRSRALEGTALYSRAACMYEWLMYVCIYIYRYTDIYTVI